MKDSEGEKREGERERSSRQQPRGQFYHSFPSTVSLPENEIRDGGKVIGAKCSVIINVKKAARFLVNVDLVPDGTFRLTGVTHL